MHRAGLASLVNLQVSASSEESWAYSDVPDAEFYATVRGPAALDIVRLPDLGEADFRQTVEASPERLRSCART